MRAELIRAHPPLAHRPLTATRIRLPMRIITYLASAKELIAHVAINAIMCYQLQRTGKMPPDASTGEIQDTLASSECGDVHIEEQDTAAGDYSPASSECGDVHNEEDSSSTPSEMAGAFVWRPGCVPPPEVCNYRVRPVVGTQLPDLCRAVACVRLKRGLRPLRFL